jgi:hypothetical protein
MLLYFGVAERNAVKRPLYVTLLVLFTFVAVYQNSLKMIVLGRSLNVLISHAIGAVRNPLHKCDARCHELAIY